MRPRSQCVGGMLLVMWCYKHVLNCLKREAEARRIPTRVLCAPLAPADLQSTVVGDFKNH